MFTSEPSLSQRIERMIRETPIVDPHSLVSGQRPGVPDLAALLDHPGVRAELRSVGATDFDLDPTLPVDERVRRRIPHLAKTRNTATSWALFRIFRELYDFHDPVLTESNHRPLLEAVADAGRDPNRAEAVLRDKCGFRAVVSEHGTDRGVVSRRLDMRSLFERGRTAEALAEFLGEIPGTAARLESKLKDRLDAASVEGAKFAGTSASIGTRLDEPTASKTEAALERLRDGRSVADVEADALLAFVAWKTMEWHHEHRKAFQLAVRAVDLHDHDLTGAFRRFNRARFNLLVGSDVEASRAAAVALEFPNVSLLGCLSPEFSPTTIESNAAFLLQSVPMTKWCAFASDASSVEWTYGRFQVVKKAVARALASLVEAGCYEEDEVPAILKVVLHDAPSEIYELG